MPASSPFLTKLPRELRDKIYRYVVIFDDPIRPDSYEEFSSDYSKHIFIRRCESEYWENPGKDDAQYWDRTDGKEALVFLVNKQIYAEFREIFWKKNKFHFSIPRLQTQQHLRPAVFQIPHLVLDVRNTDDLLWTAKLLSQTSPFKHLRIRTLIRPNRNKQKRAPFTFWEPDQRDDSRLEEHQSEQKCKIRRRCCQCLFF